MPRRNNAKKPHTQPQFSVAYTCDHKRRFATQKQAVAAKENQELLHMTLELAVYACHVPGCGGWHLTQINKQ